MAYRDVVLADSPVAYWRLGEPSGTDAVDEMGAHDGVYSGTPTLGAVGFISGDPDTSVDFIAASSSMVTITGSSWWVSGTDMTLEVWADFVGTPGSNLAVAGCRTIADAANAFFIVHLTNGNLECRFKNSAAANFDLNPPMTAGIHHVVMVKQGASLRVYRDGLLAASRADLSGSISGVFPDTYIAKFGDGSSAPYDHRIDEVAVYATALTEAQAALHYAVGVGRWNVRSDYSKFPKSMLGRVA